MSRWAALLAGRVVGMIVLAALAVLGLSTSASAGESAGAALPMGLCTISANVVVAVDFAHWGGPIVRACGATPTSGFDLVNEGGFHTVGTQHDGPGFICRISSSAFGGTDYPRASEPGESCVLTPPTTGYWAYWHADAGQNSWSYSSTGATEYHPPPGSVDLWVFGSTSTGGGSGSGVPSFSPNSVRATNTEPVIATTTTTSPTTGRPSSAPRSSASPTAHASSAPGTSSSATSAKEVARTTATATTPSASSATPSTAPPTVPTSAGPGSTPAQATPTVIDAAPTAAGRGSSGSIWPVLVTIVVAALLAGGAAFTVRRRRSS